MSAVDRVAAERRVHDAAHVVQGAQRARWTGRLQAQMGLVQQEGLQDRVRLRWYRSSLATSIMPAFLKKRSLIGRSAWGVPPWSACMRSSMLSSRIWLSWATALAAQ
jgi:hypothetical protein